MLESRSAIPLIVLALAGVFSLIGCSRKRSIGREEARSEIRQARSFAAESEMFLDFVLQGDATHRYAEGHSVYLEEAVEQLAKELGQATPETDVENSVRECQTKLSTLAGELSRIPAAIGANNEPALLSARERIRQIRASLEKANSRL
jgi:hypothetical protein